MDSYEVERIAEDVARRIGRDIELQVDSVERDMQRDMDSLKRMIDEHNSEIRTLRSSLQGALDIASDLSRQVIDLSRVVAAHQEAFKAFSRVGDGL